MSVEDFSHITLALSNKADRNPDPIRQVIDPEAATLDQHEKNLIQDGVYYKVVKEEPIRQRYVSILGKKY